MYIYIYHNQIDSLVKFICGSVQTCLGFLFKHDFQDRGIFGVPSGTLTVCSGQSPFLSSVNQLFQWPLPIAKLSHYQRVAHFQIMSTLD